MTRIKLETNYGNIIINLYKDMPITTNNFINLVKNKTYDNTISHRVIKDFMVQAGDPTGTGFGDNSIPNIADEWTHTSGNNNNRGTISMANAGPNTGSSQFFLNLVDNSHLNSAHPVFGKIIEGIDVLDAIGCVSTNNNNKPLSDVKIIRASVL